MGLVANVELKGGTDEVMLASYLLVVCIRQVRFLVIQVKSHRIGKEV